MTLALTASGLDVAVRVCGGLPWLFAARSCRGGSAVTWVVGLLIAYRPRRGRITGIVMSGTSFGVLTGYGRRLVYKSRHPLPFIAVACVAALNAVGSWIDMPRPPLRAASPQPCSAAIAVCVIATIGSGTSR
jgi:hypothetical protein